MITTTTVARLLKNLVRHRLRPNRALTPLLVTWHVTWRCNLECTYCRFPVYPGKEPPMPAPGETPRQVRPDLGTEDARRLLRLLAERAAFLGFTGGEPLVRPDLAVLAEEARSLGLAPVALTTNGILLRRHEALLRHVDAPWVWDITDLVEPGTTETISYTTNYSDALDDGWIDMHSWIVFWK